MRHTCISLGFPKAFESKNPSVSKISPSAAAKVPHQLREFHSERRTCVHRIAEIFFVPSFSIKNIYIRCVRISQKHQCYAVPYPN